MYILDPTGRQILFASTTDNIAAGDPLEMFQISCDPGPFDCVAAFLIVNHTGPNPGRFKYILFGSSGNVTTSPILNSGTVFGHANALSAVTVGAASYQQTPAFRPGPPVREPFSSSGTTPILFDTAGNRLATPDPRQFKPEIVAPDGVNTTFLGVDSDFDTFPNFFGTSAAAPHAAAVAALMLQAVPTLSPVQIRTALENTAVDMGPSGFDSETGFGLIQADAALNSVVPKAATTTNLTSSSNPAVVGQAVTLTATVSALPPGAGTPTGLATFFDGATTLVTVPLNPAGQAAFTTSTLSSGLHTITVSYAGDTHFNGSAAPALIEAIVKADSTTGLVASANPLVFGRGVTFTASVSVVSPGAGTPTGSVTFFDGATPLGSPSLNAAGQATVTTSALSVGTHPITATYSGDANVNASTSVPVTETVTRP